MRPLKLELEGFSAFRERAEVDFAGAELFVLTGPTGSGKSSLIDALTFALYGSVPRYDDKRLVGPSITQGKTEARVRFDFSVGETEYTAVRVVRRTRTGGATTKEARLQRGETVLADTADDVTDAVAALLGLDFEQFTRCVVLPQGDFAEFLHDKPSRRQKLLTRLLGIDLYQKLHDRAVERETAAKAAAAALAGQLASMADSTPQALEAAEKRIAKLEKLKETVEEAIPGLEELEEEIEAAGESREKLAEEIERMEELEVPEGIENLGRRLDAAREAETKAVAGVEAAEEAVEEARSRRDALGSPDDLKQAHRDHEALAAARKAIEGAEKGAKAAGAAAARSGKAIAAAEEKLEAAAKALEEVRTAHAARHLARGLAKGEPCPVCLQPVAKLPRHPAPPGEAAVEAAVAEAKEDLADARADGTKAAAADSVAREKVSRLQGEIADLTARTKGALPPGEIVKKLAAIDAAGKSVAKVEEAFKAARTGAAGARKALEAARKDQVRAQREFDAARDGVAGLEPPAADREDPAGAWKALAAWAEKKAAAHRKQMEKEEARMKKLGAKREKQVEKLRAACGKLEVAFDEDAPRDGVVDALAGVGKEHEGIRKDLERSAELRAKVGETEKQGKVAASLARHLTATGFERWLLSEAMDRLVAEGSTVLEEISDGQYSFARDRSNNFEVVDHRNADETRSVKTLSGGETFLASLALALTLVEHVAEMASEGSARLESIFLDEGFGSLDPHTLDMVASTIEELSAGDRVVGLVTHVRELADRIPVRFQVTKGPTTAAVERVVS